MEGVYSNEQRDSKEDLIEMTDKLCKNNIVILILTYCHILSKSKYIFNLESTKYI